MFGMAYDPDVLRWALVPLAILFLYVLFWMVYDS